MTPRLPIRPVLVLCAAATLSGCGMVESDPHRFEKMAQGIAAIPLDGGRPAPTVAAASAQTAGLRPALRVEVLDPHALWDARDGGLKAMTDDVAPRIAAAAAPVVANAVVETVATRIDGVAARAGLRSTAESAGPGPLVQIGAYSSEALARAAWTRLRQGPNADVLAALTPVFEDVEVDGRSLTRLKVRAPADGAASLCAAVGIDDPWCRRAA